MGLHHLGHMHCMAPAHVPVCQTCSQEYICRHTLWDFLFIHGVCSDTQSLANTIPELQRSPDSQLDLLCFTPFPECGLVQSLCRGEGHDPQAPPSTGECIPTKAHCLYAGCSVLSTQIVKNYFSKFALLSKCFLFVLSNGMGPFALSLQETVLSALSVLFCSQSICL